MTIKYHHDMQQLSGDWYAARTGVLTASQIKSFITAKLTIAKKLTKGETTPFGYELVGQRAMNHVEETFQSWDMQRGNVEEIHAKDLYSKHYAQIKDCGFVTNDEWGFTIGYSPDGLIGDDGLIEVKSRKQKFQAETIITNEVPEEYMLQIQTGLLVSGREWCDFISYSNGMPMFVKRVEPDAKTQSVIIEAAKLFEAQAHEDLFLYNKHSENLFTAERRDYETGEIIKPSHNAEEFENILAAG